jgi:hypothetical protein
MSEKKKRKRMHGTVAKVIPSLHPGEVEKAEIDIHDAEPLYREVRVENEVTDEDGNKARLKSGTEVDIIIEAKEEATAHQPTELKHRK